MSTFWFGFKGVRDTFHLDMETDMARPAHAIEAERLNRLQGAFCDQARLGVDHKSFVCAEAGLMDRFGLVTNGVIGPIDHAIDLETGRNTYSTMDLVQ